MDKLEEYIKKNSYTQEEYENYKKVQKYFYVEDLKNVLDDMIENGELSKSNIEKIINNYDIIIKNYDKWLDEDWYATMKEAIYSIL